MRFSEVELGDELPESHPDISLEKVRKFVGAAGMNFPRFTDHEFARSEGLPLCLCSAVSPSAPNPLIFDATDSCLSLTASLHQTL